MSYYWEGNSDYAEDQMYLEMERTKKLRQEAKNFPVFVLAGIIYDNKQNLPKTPAGEVILSVAEKCKKANYQASTKQKNLLINSYVINEGFE